MTFTNLPRARGFATENFTTKGSNLMILSYMRAGSSMNGQVFRDDEDAFYIFEPLIKYAPFQYLTENRFCEMGNLKCSKWTNSTAGIPVEDTIEDIVKALKNIYSCNLKDLDDGIMRNIMFENKKGQSKSSNIWSDFTRCYLKLTKPEETDIEKYFKDSTFAKSEKHKHVLKLLNETDSKSAIFRSCLESLESKCREAKIRVTKVLRLSLRFVPRLMAQFPNLKFMFIMRDPRGNLNSRILTQWFPVNESKTAEVQNHIISVCFQMTEDVKMVTHLKHNFPGRFIDFRLEDIVRNPTQSFKGLFKMLNMELSPMYKEKLSELFVAKPNFETSWKSALKEKYIKLVESECRRVLEFYKYELLQS